MNDVAAQALGRFEPPEAQDHRVDQGQDRLARDGFEVARRKRVSFGIHPRPLGSELHDDAGFGRARTRGSQLSRRESEGGARLRLLGLRLIRFPLTARLGSIYVFLTSVPTIQIRGDS
jgi:hypothetical protein